MIYDPFALERLRFEQVDRQRRAPRVGRLRSRDARRLALAALAARRSSDV